MKKSKQILGIFLLFCCMLVSIGFPFQNDTNLDPPNSSKDGEEVWRKTVELDNCYTGGYSIWGDHKFLYTCGYKYNLSTHIYDLFVIKWKQNGRIIWSYSYLTNNDTVGSEIWGDENFLYVCGYSRNDLNQKSYFLLKLNTDGLIIWNRQWGLPSGNKKLDSLRGDNSFIYIFGGGDHIPNNKTERILMKWDKNGNNIWNNTWYDNDIESYEGIVLDETHIYLCGTTPGENMNTSDIRLVKWNKDGNLHWNRTCIVNEDFSFDLSDSIIDSESIYICGQLSSDDNYYGYLGKIDNECNLIWNRTWDIEKNTFMLAICNNTKEIFVTGTKSPSSISSNGTTYLYRWNKEGEKISFDQWNSTYSDQSHFLGSWADDKNLFICGVPNNEGYLTLIRWDISKNYFLRIGLPIILVSLISAILWVVIKPVYQVRKSRIKKELDTLSHEIHTGGNYEDLRSELEEILPEIESFNDSIVWQQWNSLYNIVSLNCKFRKELLTLKKTVEKGGLELASEELTKLLKKSHFAEYDGIVDREIISDISDLLKEVSTILKNSESKDEDLF